MALHEPTRRVAPGATNYWRLQGGLVSLGIIVLATIVQAKVSPAGWLTAVMWVLVVLLVVLLVGVMPAWRYAVHRWEVTDDAVSTRTGWWISELRVAPISRVQTVDTERGPLMRWLGLSTVTVTTASSRGSLRIPALDESIAARLVAEVTAISAADERDAT